MHSKALKEKKSRIRARVTYRIGVYNYFVKLNSEIALQNQKKKKIITVKHYNRIWQLLYG